MEILDPAVIDATRHVVLADVLEEAILASATVEHGYTMSSHEIDFNTVNIN